MGVKYSLKEYCYIHTLAFSNEMSKQNRYEVHIKHFLKNQGHENNNVISEMISATAILCGQLKDRVLTQAITINIDTSSKTIIASTLRALKKLGKT